MATLTRRESLAAIAGFFAFAGAGLWLFWPQTKSPAGQVGGPFQLVDADGLPFTFKDIQGKPSLVYFGFTHCPDICPTTLFLMSQVLDRLGPDASRINALFITVDPDRDTPDQMKSYLTAYPPVRGLTGDRAHLAVAWDIYGIEAVVVPTTSSNYNMDHTSDVFLLDQSGRFRSTFDLNTKLEVALADVRALLA
ncbi:SCO family protein [Labrys okinawensis]|uniref:SCO family protein n=1 Tax=Labrys okinawensis TaxID=346911 RepID=UPI0039BC48DD